MRTIISETPRRIGEAVELYGWVEKRRDHGQLVFFDLRDRTGVIQVVGGKDLADVRPMDAVKVVGLIKDRPEGTENKNLLTGSVELDVQDVQVVTKAQTLPFDMGAPELNLELPTLLDWRTLTLRHPKVRSIFKIQEAVMEGFRYAVKKIDCTEIFVPTISASATEGGAEVFKVNYYDRPAYLIQSPQLYKQMMVPVYERVFVVAHAYRAEPSVTTRHLSEVIMMDCEIGFASFEELLDLMEGVATDMVGHVEENCAPLLEEFGCQKVAFGKIPRLKLSEIQEIIYKEFGRDNRGEKDLSPQDEIDICKWAKDTHSSDFVTVTHFPTKKRAFYTKPDPENPEFSLSYDLLFRGVEILSGSQRINDYDELVVAIKDCGMDPKDFEMYLQAFRFGMPPEGGFSFGLERVTMHILGLGNIREASLFPRDMERVDVRLATMAQNDGKQKNKK